MPHGMDQASGHQKYSCSCGLTQHSSRLSGKCKQCHSSLKPKKSQAEIEDFSSSQPSVATTTIGSDISGGSQSGVRSYQNDSPATNRLTTDRRRSRSADRSDSRRNINEPPPYYTLVDYNLRRNVGLHRTGSEEPTYRTQSRRIRATPPPSYTDAESSNPPSYEEALASSMSRLSTNSGLSALIATTPALRERSYFSSGFFETPSSARSETHRVSHRDPGGRNGRRLTQRQAEREAQRQRDHEQEELERQRLRELQVAQYCGCAKCQSLFYDYYYDEASNSATPFPMETQVIMQQFFGDGLTFCSLM